MTKAPDFLFGTPKEEVLARSQQEAPSWWATGLEKLEIETEGDIDLRGFLGIDSSVPAGYENLRYTVRIKESGTKKEFVEVHNAVMATSPNFYNLARPVSLKPTFVVE
jgi:hypothetical protein